jgi:mRNA interferase MazF
MTRYKQGDVVLVPFPYTDLSGNKKRPGLIVSANWYNEQEPNYILVPITSVIHDPLARHETLIQGAEAKQAGLLYNSVVKVGKSVHHSSADHFAPNGSPFPSYAQTHH